LLYLHKNKIMQKEIRLSADIETSEKKQGYLNVSVLYDIEENLFSDVVIKAVNNGKYTDITDSIENFMGANALYATVANKDWRAIYREAKFEDY
jgi:hypothetical protein